MHVENNIVKLGNDFRTFLGEILAKKVRVPQSEIFHSTLFYVYHVQQLNIHIRVGYSMEFRSKS